jgi:hypothetical protein
MKLTVLGGCGAWPAADGYAGPVSVASPGLTTGADR